MARGIRNPTWKEKYAGALLRIRNEDGSWLIPEPLRSEGTTDEVVAATQMDHSPPVTFGGDNRPQHLFPMLTLAHRKKSKIDNFNAKKTTRLMKKEAEHKRKRQEKIEAIRHDVLATKVRVREKKPKPKFDWKKGRYVRSS